MRKLYLVCFALILGIAMVLPVALPAGAAPCSKRPVAWVNSFNYENHQNLPNSDGGHVISVTLLSDGTTVGYVQVFDRLTHMIIISTGFDQTPGVTRFWNENGARIAEFVVYMKGNANNPFPYNYDMTLKYRIEDHGKLHLNDCHYVSYFDGTVWYPPTFYPYILGGAHVHLRD